MLYHGYHAAQTRSSELFPTISAVFERRLFSFPYEAAEVFSGQLGRVVG
jgi:hypothetical protein